MSMSMPADDCCGEGMDQAKCLSACLAASPAMASPASQPETPAAASSIVALPSFRHVSIPAPPDIAPPKSFVS
jgi:hypothetical protein